MLHDDNAHIFAAFLLISYCSSSSRILSLIVIIIFHVFPKRLCLKRKILSGTARVVSLFKKEYDFAVHFFKRFTKSLNSISAE